MNKSLLDYEASKRIMRANIELYKAGTVDSYRVVATELRKLLCDRDPLIVRLFDNIALHKFHTTKTFEGMPSLSQGIGLIIPARIEFGSSGLQSTRLSFANPLEEMPLSSWLQQIILFPDLTVRMLIRAVADKEGAHSDRSYNEHILRAKLVKFGQSDSYIPIIVAIGEYILDFLDAATSEDNR